VPLRRPHLVGPERLVPDPMNGPAGVCWVTAPGMPIAAGTCRATPFTKIVRCAWMWNSVCSLVWQLIPSTVCPVAFDAVPASGAAPGIGTPSGPIGPPAGAARSVPSVLSAANVKPPWPDAESLAGEPPPPWPAR